MLRGLIQRPIGVLMFFAALVVVGILGYSRLPVDLLPSIRYPRLTVFTTYDDVPAEDLERLVTRPLEEVVTALSGVREVVSRTREGISTITVEYEWGTQMDFANLNLREAIDRVAFRDDFPEAAERPLILRWDPTSRPISVLVLRGQGRLEALTEFAREVAKPALEQVTGLSQAEVVGGADREILVRPDPRRMASYGISMEQLRAALARSNISFPGGKVKQGPRRLSLRIDGEYRDLEEIAATDIVRRDGQAIRVGDVAEVLDTTKEPEGITLLGEDTVVSLLLYKEPDANTLQVSSRVDESLGNLQTQYPDFAWDFVYRDADYVRESFAGLRQSLLLGGILAILVLFVFLRDWVSPLVVGLNIPVAITITFGLLHFGGVKLNLMSLGGLSLAAGMLVDNAIVVLENIHRKLRGQSPPEGDTLLERGPGDPGDGRRQVAKAAEAGAREMARPVFASTLTTVAVFFPVVYVPGIAGAFFRDQALTVTLSLAVSIVTALVGQAVLSAWLLPPGEEKPRGIFKWFAAGFERIHHFYHGVLLAALRRPWPLLAMLVLLLAGCGWWLQQLDRSFLPERSQGNLRVEVELPSGTPLEATAGTTADLAGWIGEQAGVQTVFSQVGRTQRTLAALQEDTSPHIARLLIVMEPGRGAWERAMALRDRIAARLDEGLEGVEYAFSEEGIGLGEILGEDAGFRMGVLADDPLAALEAARQIRDAIVDVEGLDDLQVDRVLGTPNVVVGIDREEALRSGLDPDRLAAELRARVAGVEATTFNEVDQRIDIAVRYARNQREDLSMALDAPVELPNGGRVPLRSFLTTREERPVRELMRHNQRRMVMLRGEVEGGNLDRAWNEADRIAAGLDLPGGVRWIQAGEAEEMRRSFRDLGLALLLAILLVYMILAAQFESFLDPLLIAAVLPIGLAGSTVAIGLTHGSMNILSIIGVLALLGIAVNDAIVKVDTIRRLQEDEGLDGWDAILETSRLRLRPILMTSATTVLAMVPMAIGLGEGEQMQRPLAITIIGGLTLTTALTLIYTPLMYMLAHRIRPRDEEAPAP